MWEKFKHGIVDTLIAISVLMFICWVLWKGYEMLYWMWRFILD